MWKEYKKYVWGYDEYYLISKIYLEWFGVGLIIVDFIDIVIIMGFKDGKLK